jgi:AcrR family transcriptional regulator
LAGSQIPTTIPPDDFEPGAPSSRLSANQLSRRERVIDAAYDLLTTMPYERIQMREVSEESGVAVATVYRYFKSKELLFAHVLVRWVNRFGTRVQNRPVRGPTNGDRLVDVFTRSIRAFQRMPQFFSAFQMVETCADPEARELIRQLANELNATYATALVGVEPDTVSDIIFACNAVMNQLLKAWTLGQCDIDDVYRSMERSIRLLLGSTGVSPWGDRERARR